MIKPANAGGWVLYAVGVIAFGVLARVGWELGGRLWGLLG